MGSFHKLTTIQCKCCDKSFEFRLWQIVDVEEQPYLFEQIKDESIHKGECPHCGCKNYVNEPLLVIQKNRKPHLLFVPDKNSSYEENRKVVTRLLKKMKEDPGSTWNDKWVGSGIPGLSLKLVANAIEKSKSEKEIPPKVQTILGSLSKPIKSPKELPIKIEQFQKDGGMHQRLPG